VIWPGDLDATFTHKGEKFTSGGKSYAGVGGLPVALAYALSLGPSGFPFFASDTGGYIHSPPSRELFLRWTEANTVSSAMEVGDHPSDTCLFGDDLLVAPVVAAGQSDRKVTLPAGDWIDWFDGTVYSGGGEVTVPAPLDRLPLLVRAGGIVPLLRPTIDTVAP